MKAQSIPFCRSFYAGWCVRLCCIALSFLFVHAAEADCDTGHALRGVNLSGAEFNSGKLPGRVNFDYVYPTPTEMKYFAGIGMNTIRLPFRWERIQRTLFGDLDPGELNNLVSTVETAKSLGLCVILDLHNFGAYRGNAIGTPLVPGDAFLDVWTRLTSQFANDAFVAFGLMNEPAALKIDEWAALAQRAVMEIRNFGASNLILVSGGRWSGVHEWEKQIGTRSNAQAFARFQDPARRTLIEVHQYADSNFSGTRQECLPGTTFTTMFDNIARWARVHSQKLFLGEFGVPPNQQCLDALGAILARTNDKSVWYGWTYWAAGRWWRNYPMNITPKDDHEPPQTTVLKAYLGKR